MSWTLTTPVPRYQIGINYFEVMKCQGRGHVVRSYSTEDISRSWTGGEDARRELFLVMGAAARLLGSWLSED